MPMANPSREAFLKKAQAGVQKAFGQPDLLIVQAVRSMDDLDEASSLLSQRLDEWFRLNHPQFATLEGPTAARLIATAGAKEKFTESELAKIVPASKAKELADAAKKGYGGKFSDEDAKAVTHLARAIVTLNESKGQLEKYVSSVARQVAPNVCALVEPVVAARLIETAGSLEKLARMPASTIQVIGAEKALFKHLKFNSKPPKHGSIFAAGLVHNAPLEERGRIARALAGKICIAAKADTYSKRDISKQLKADLEARLAQIHTPQAPAASK